jgi:hypothetical protein
LSDYGPPPPKAVRWVARQWGGGLYEHEKRVGGRMRARRRRGVVVWAQTHYLARQRAGAELLLAPEHVVVVQEGGG